MLAMRKTKRSHRGDHLFAVGLSVCLALFTVGGTYAGEDLPDAEKLIERSVEAAGGKAAFEKVTNRMMQAKITFGGVGIEAKVQSYSAAPGSSYSRMEITDIGTVEEGCDGKIAWENSAMMGPRVKTGEELAVSLRQNTFNPELKWRELYTEYETKGVVDIDGKPAYEVLMVPKVGKPETTFFDKKTGLPVKNNMTVTTNMGEIAVETLMMDYRKVDGILMPFTIKQTAGPQQITIEIQKVEHNVKIPEGRFDPPAEIKALAEKSESKTKMPEVKLDKQEP